MKKLIPAALLLLAPLALVAVLSAPASAAPAGSSGAPDGKAVFLAQKCEMCHSVSSAGIEAKMKTGKMAGPDLKGIGEQKDAAWLHKWLKREVEIDGRKHLKTFTGSDEELNALIDWLQAQK